MTLSVAAPQELLHKGFDFEEKLYRADFKKVQFFAASTEKGASNMPSAFGVIDAGEVTIETTQDFFCFKFWVLVKNARMCKQLLYSCGILDHQVKGG